MKIKRTRIFFLFHFCKISFFCIGEVTCDSVHDVETMHDLYLMLKYLEIFSEI